MPIPRYDGTIPLHREITALCTQAEKVAVRTVTAELEADPGREQVSLSKAVRNALANDGIAAAMDEWCPLMAGFDPSTEGRRGSDSPRRRGRVDAWLDQPFHNRLRQPRTFARHGRGDRHLRSG